MATPYETILQYVMDDVKRPDMLDVINRRIQRALLYYHRFEKFQKDMIEQIYVFSPPESMASLYSSAGSNSLFMTQMAPVNRLYLQDIDKRLLTRFRSVAYINKWAAYDAFNGTTAGGELTERNPDSMFDGYGGMVDDVFYESGDFIKIKSGTPLSQLYIGYFCDPVLDPVANIYSWIAKDYPSVIACAVKTRIFSDIGKQDELRTAAAELKLEEMSLLSNNIKLSLRK